ncbi:putative Pentatricopeptide repeat-containing protein [Zostera marina]|uniref:Putative Pentatricopeptide repeat-containing protein n=1 Tax=Zostera marina TaxID=29655 RepID=A0A0K9Q099_ZOSMR|nr:putative Pentatricopeptide repeat-containing protein [Zostera marina]
MFSAMQPFPKFTSISNLIKNGGIQNTTMFCCNKLIEFYFKTGAYNDARRMFDEMPHRNVFTWNTMIHGCIRAGKLADARSVFDCSPDKDSVTYNSMISGYAVNSCETHAVELFKEMRSRGVPVDDYTISTMLNVTAKLSDVEYGRQIHGTLIKMGNDVEGFKVSSLIDMYSKCGSFSDARHVFKHGEKRGVLLDMVTKNAMIASCCREGEIDIALDLFWRIPYLRDVVSWNTLISGCAQNGRPEISLRLFIQMVSNTTSDGIAWNKHTIAGILKACTDLKRLMQGKQVHAAALKKLELSSNQFLTSSIVNFYNKCGHLTSAEAVYRRIHEENLFATTSMIVGYLQNGMIEEAMSIFDSLSETNSAVWTAVFNGYLKSQRCQEVFDLFRDSANHDPMIRDVSVLITVICACAIQADLGVGKQIHGFMTRIGISTKDLKPGTAIVDMYAKCGKIGSAEEIFNRVISKDRVLYNAMIAGFAHNGQEMKSVLLFEEMVTKKNCAEPPDAATFIALLSACRHGGLVETGEKYFNDMLTKYGIAPELDHYSSMVDLLGRANQLDKALALMKTVPFELDSVIWGTLLSSCWTNGNTKLAVMTEEVLLKMDMQNSSRYVQLANTFASKGEWREVERVRRKMKGGYLTKKLAGCSWVQVENKINVFTSGDKFHSEAEAVYDTTESLNNQMIDYDLLKHEMIDYD